MQSSRISIIINCLINRATFKRYQCFQGDISSDNQIFLRIILKNDMHTTFLSVGLRVVQEQIRKGDTYFTLN